MFLNELKRGNLFLVQYHLFLDESTFSPRLFLVQFQVLFLEASVLFLVDSLYIVFWMRLFLVHYALFLEGYVLFLGYF